MRVVFVYGKQFLYISMLGLFTYSFWLIFIFIYYLIYSYRNSKNKSLFFKTGMYRPLLSTLSLLIIALIIINFLLPELGLKLDTLRITHTDDAHQKSLLAAGNSIGYCSGILSVIWHNMNLTGFVSALLILITWFIYMYRIDIFHKENLKYSLITLFSGMGFSLLTFLISDMVNLVYHRSYAKFRMNSL